MSIDDVFVSVCYEDFAILNLLKLANFLARSRIASETWGIRLKVIYVNSHLEKPMQCWEAVVLK